MFGIKSTKQFMVAQNCLIAKYTYDRLDEATRKRVINEAIRILETGGYPSTRAKELPNWEENKRYLFYSIAMLHLEIQPMLQGILYHDRWNIITGNFFSLLLNSDKAFEKAKLMIKNRLNINVELN